MDELWLLEFPLYAGILIKCRVPLHGALRRRSERACTRCLLLMREMRDCSNVTVPT
jgi:hypothetical protein